MSSTTPQDDQKKKIIIAVGAAAGIAVAVLAYKAVARYMGNDKTPPSSSSRSSRRVVAEGKTDTAAADDDGDERTAIKRPTTPTSPTEITEVFKKLSASESGDMSQWKTYTNEQLGISFMYPPDYAEPELISSGIGSGYIIAVGMPDQTPSCPIAVEQVPAGIPIDDIADQQMQMMQMMGGHMRLADKKSNGMDARVLRIEVRDPQSGRSSSMEITMMQKQNRVFTVRQDLGADKNQQRIIDRIIGSITAGDVSTVGTLSFHSVRHNLDIDLPTVEFKIKADSDNEAVILNAVIESMSSNEVLSGIRITSKPKREYSANLEMLVDRRREKLSGKSGFTEAAADTDAQQLTVCGQETHIFEYMDTLDGSKCQFMEALFVLDKHTFIATLFSKPDLYASFRESALKSLRNMKIDEEGPTRSQDVITYVNSKHNFSIEVEKEVTMMENLMTDPVVTLTYLKGGEKEEEMRMFQSMVTIEDSEFGNDIEMIRAQLKRHIQQPQGPFGMPASIKSDEIVKINDREAVAVSFLTMDQMLNIVHLIPLDGKIYTVKTQTPVDGHDKELDSKIQKVHRSFKILN